MSKFGAEDLFTNSEGFRALLTSGDSLVSHGQSCMRRPHDYSSEERRTVRSSTWYRSASLASDPTSV